MISSVRHEEEEKRPGTAGRSDPAPLLRQEVDVLSAASPELRVSHADDFEF